MFLKHYALTPIVLSSNIFLKNNNIFFLDAEKAAKMYSITSEDFLKVLLRPRVKVGTEWVNKGQNIEQVAWSVGAMAKELYSRIFNWLVEKCNKTLIQKGTNKDFFIGVLDIAGFEIFDVKLIFLNIT